MFNYSDDGAANTIVFFLVFIVVAAALPIRGAAQPPTTSPVQATETTIEAEAAPPFRTWVDSTGEFRTEARLVEFDGEVATLFKSNGVTIHVPIDKLSTRDREYLADWWDKSRERNGPEDGLDEPPARLVEHNVEAAEVGPAISPAPLLVRNEAVWGYVDVLLEACEKQVIGRSKMSSADLANPKAQGTLGDEQQGLGEATETAASENRVAVSDSEIDPVAGVQPDQLIPRSEVEATGKSGNGLAGLVGLAGLAGRRASLGPRDPRNSSTDVDAMEKRAAPDRVENRAPVEMERRPDPREADRSTESASSAEPAIKPESTLGNGGSNEPVSAGEIQPAPTTSSRSGPPGDAGSLKVEYADLERPMPGRSWVKAQPADVRPLLNALISGDDPVQIRRALRHFGEHSSIVMDDGYWDILAHYVLGEDKFSRLEGLKAMHAIAPERMLPYLIYLLDDSTFEVRWQVYDYLAEVEDDRVIEPLVDHYLTNERNQIEILLVPYGSKTETLLFRFLRHSDVEVRSDVVKFLGKVGSEASVEALRQLENDPSVTVRLQARSSIRRIEKRLGTNNK